MDKKRLSQMLVPRGIVAHKKLTLSLIMLIAILAFAFAAIPRLSVHAGGAVGGGGGGSSGTGGAQTRYGFGWYNFPSNGSTKPQLMRDGGDWSDVMTRCRAEGANRIIAFIVFQSTKTVATSVVYRYDSDWTSYTGYRKPTSVSWLTASTARSYYDSIDAAYKTGFNWGQGNSKSVAWFCYSTIPPSNFTLKPTVTASPSVIERGSTVTVVPVVTNTPGTTKSTAGQWKLIKEVNSDSEEIVPPTTLPVINSGSNWSTSHLDNDTNNYPVGTHIYYTLSIKPGSNSNAGWVSSAKAEVVVGVKPKIQITASDLSAGGLITTSNSKKGSSTYGSWVEYGIIAAGIIKGTASGSAFSGPNGLPSTETNYSKLSFANTNNVATTVGVTRVCSTGSTPVTDAVGCYKSVRSIPDISASFPGGTSITSGSVKSPSANLSTNAVNIYTVGSVSTPGIITLSDSTLIPGKTVIIKAIGGTVIIDKNQLYSPGPYTNILQLPQLVIIADSIVINSDVTQVDAWLVAKNVSKTGSIYTCEIQGRSVSECSSLLTVNGPVMADKIYLRRTGGSGTGANSGDPAEVFNLRADAYLWSAARASSGSRIQTVYTTELPPRF